MGRTGGVGVVLGVGSFRYYVLLAIGRYTFSSQEPAEFFRGPPLRRGWGLFPFPRGGLCHLRDPFG